MKLRAKAWLEQDGDLVFGPGRARLLRAVDRRGSISAAAEELDMNYRHAWSMLNASERRLGRPLVESSRGGPGGGGAKLTDTGRKLLDAFEKLESVFEKHTQERQNEVEDLLD